MELKGGGRAGRLMPYHLNSSGKVINVRLLNLITEGDSAHTGATSKTNTAQRGGSC